MEYMNVRCRYLLNTLVLIQWIIPQILFKHVEILNYVYPCLHMYIVLGLAYDARLMHIRFGMFTPPDTLN